MALGYRGRLVRKRNTNSPIPGRTLALVVALNIRLCRMKINPTHIETPSLRRIRRAFARSAEDSTENRLTRETILCCTAHRPLIAAKKDNIQIDGSNGSGSLSLHCLPILRSIVRFERWGGGNDKEAAVGSHDFDGFLCGAVEEVDAEDAVVSGGSCRHEEICSSLILFDTRTLNSRQFSRRHLITNRKPTCRA
jgi:hypothetical protein